jgi:hypothetical protein
MAGQLGRVLVGGKDLGAGFALGPRLVVTANHVVRDRGIKPVVYVPAGGEPVVVERVQPDAAHDAAVLRLTDEVGEFLPASAAVRGAGWRVESPPGGNDPQLHGTVTAARMTIQNASGEPVEVAQLEVGEQLGNFGGYSGSAVLDVLGRAVLALLVEQKPLRTPVALGEPPMATNVLYAVPIRDVIAANGLPAQAARPPRFDVGLAPRGMVARPGLLDEATGRVIGAEGGEAGAGLVVLRGPGGVGKTVLARQIADDVRVWAEFTDGIVMLRAGQTATADGLTRQLQETLGYQDRYLLDVLDGQRLLLILDDVWDRELLGTLRAGLPPTVTVLATTRGVYVADAAAVPVGAVSRDEAIQILARNTARTGELDQALDGLAQTLFHSALLLTLAAAQIHPDDELDLMFSDEDSSQPGGEEPDMLIGRADALRAKVSDAPTTLDDHIDLLVRSSLDWLGSGHTAQFELLAIYPPGAEITQPMLEDLWEASPDAAQEGTKLLVRAGLAQPVRRDRLTIELHDLITAWLHHSCGRPEDSRHQTVHQRMAALSMLPDGTPGELTRDRVQWLAHHLVSAGAWDRLQALPTVRWRSAFLATTGSDAAFLDALDRYGHIARAQAPDALYHSVRAWLFAAHVKDLVGQLPVPLLAAMALVTDPIAAITQACQHSSAGKAVPAVLAAVAVKLDVRPLIDQALALAGTIPDDKERSGALAGIAGVLAGADPRDPALIQRALALANAIPDNSSRDRALDDIAGRLAGAEPVDPVLIEQALATAEAIVDDGLRSWALAGIARRLAAADPAQAAVLIERAVTVAETIPNDQERSWVLAGIARRLAAADPAQAAVLIERALDGAETIPDDDQRSWVLAGIAEWLAGADPRDPAFIERALVVAETIPDDGLRSLTLVGIAGWLVVIDPAQAAALIERALTVAQTLPGDWESGQRLADIAGRLAGADPRDPALIERALAVAQTIPDDKDRGQALAGIAEQLAVIDPAQATALIERALALAETLPGGWQRGRALAFIADQLAASDPRDRRLTDCALAIADTIPDDWDRRLALARIAEWLASTDPPDPALIERALGVADTLPDGSQRRRVLAGIAGRQAVINPAHAEALIEQALAAAGTISDGQERGRALAGIAWRLAAAGPENPVLIERAVAVAEAIPGDAQRGETLAGIAGWLAVTDPARSAVLIEQAVAVAEAIPDDGQRGETLAGIARWLAVTDPAQSAVLIEQAVAVAEAIPDKGLRGETLAGIAGRLVVIDPARSAVLIERALTVAEAIPGDGQRGETLAHIAGRLADAGPKNPVLLKTAVAVAETIPGERERSAMLASIAGRLAAADPGDPALTERALAVARTIPDNQERSEAFARINPLTRSGMLNELARWRLRPLYASIGLLHVFLGNCHDKTIAEKIGLAVLDVAKEFPAKK